MPTNLPPTSASDLQQLVNQGTSPNPLDTNYAPPSGYPGGYNYSPSLSGYNPGESVLGNALDSIYGGAGNGFSSGFSNFSGGGVSNGGYFPPSSGFGAPANIAPSVPPPAAPAAPVSPAPAPAFQGAPASGFAPPSNPLGSLSGKLPTDPADLLKGELNPFDAVPPASSAPETPSAPVADLAAVWQPPAFSPPDTNWSGTNEPFNTNSFAGVSPLQQLEAYGYNTTPAVAGFTDTGATIPNGPNLSDIVSATQPVNFTQGPTNGSIALDLPSQFYDPNSWTNGNGTGGAPNSEFGPTSGNICWATQNCNANFGIVQIGNEGGLVYGERPDVTAALDAARTAAAPANTPISGVTPFPGAESPRSSQTFDGSGGNPFDLSPEAKQAMNDAAKANGIVTYNPDTPNSPGDSGTRGAVDQLPGAQGLPDQAKEATALAIDKNLVADRATLKDYCPTCSVRNGQVVYPDKATLNFSALQNQNFQSGLEHTLTTDYKSTFGGTAYDSPDGVHEWVTSLGQPQATPQSTVAGEGSAGGSENVPLPQARPAEADLYPNESAAAWKEIALNDRAYNPSQNEALSPVGTQTEGPNNFPAPTPQLISSETLSNAWNSAKNWASSFFSGPSDKEISAEGNGYLSTQNGAAWANIGQQENNAPQIAEQVAQQLASQPNSAPIVPASANDYAYSQQPQGAIPLPQSSPLSEANNEAAAFSPPGYWYTNEAVAFGGQPAAPGIVPAEAQNFEYPPQSAPIVPASANDYAYSQQPQGAIPLPQSSPLSEANNEAAAFSPPGYWYTNEAVAFGGQPAAPGIVPAEANNFSYGASPYAPPPDIFQSLTQSPSEQLGVNPSAPVGAVEAGPALEQPSPTSPVTSENLPPAQQAPAENAPPLSDAQIAAQIPTPNTDIPTGQQVTQQIRNTANNEAGQLAQQGTGGSDYYGPQNQSEAQAAIDNANAEAGKLAEQGTGGPGPSAFQNAWSSIKDSVGGYFSSAANSVQQALSSIGSVITGQPTDLAANTEGQPAYNPIAASEGQLVEQGAGGPATPVSEAPPVQPGQIGLSASEGLSGGTPGENSQVFAGQTPGAPGLEPSVEPSVPLPQSSPLAQSNNEALAFANNPETLYPGENLQNWGEAALRDNVYSHANGDNPLAVAEQNTPPEQPYGPEPTDAFGTSATQPSTNPVVTDQHLADQRAPLFENLTQDQKDLITRALARECGGAQLCTTGVLEVMTNKTVQNNRDSLIGTLQSGFYGPVNRGELSPNISAAERTAADNAFRSVAAGSNITNYATDQGSGSNDKPVGQTLASFPDSAGRPENFWNAGGNKSWANQQQAQSEAAFSTTQPTEQPFSSGGTLQTVSSGSGQQSAANEQNTELNQAQTQEDVPLPQPRPTIASTPTPTQTLSALASKVDNGQSITQADVNRFISAAKASGNAELMSYASYAKAFGSQYAASFVNSNPGLISNAIKKYFGR